MLHTTNIALLLLMAVLGSCNKSSIALSSQEGKKKKLDAKGVTPPEKISVDALSVPKQWPKCWLSYRLSVMTSFRTAGNRGDKWVAPTYTQEDGRQEFPGQSKNPTTSGNCVLNWFAQDYSQEPWVGLFKQEFSQYEAVVSCTAKQSPDCLCASTLPIASDSGFFTSEERCIRKSANGKNYKLYSVHEVEGSQPVPAAGRCDTAYKASEDIAKANILLGNFTQQNQDKTEVGGVGLDCRTDFEPFAPLSDEKDWYADEIRDWAITICTDQNTGCRCYAIYNKSGYEDGARSGMFEHETCLLCKDGTCQLARM